MGLKITLTAKKPAVMAQIFFYLGGLHEKTVFYCLFCLNANPPEDSFPGSSPAGLC
jgi:hypothetical protein